MLYAINATIRHLTTDENGVTAVVARQIPTFYLDASVQGIVDEQHAELIARSIICPVELQYESIDAVISAVKV